MLKRRTVSLRRLLFLLTALGLLPMALIGAWGITTAIDQQQKELERSMLGLSRALASAVDAELESTIKALRTLSSSAALTNGDLLAFYEIAREAARAHPEWTGITLRDSTGNLVFRTELPFGVADTGILDPSSLALVTTVQEPVVGHIVKAPANIATIPVRVPVTDSGGFTYTLTAMLTPDRVLEIVRRQKAPPTWVISVHDAATTRVARSRDHAKTVATGVSPTLAKLLNENKLEGTGLSRTLEGTESITAYTRLPRHDWAVVIGAPTASFREALIQSFAVYAAAIGTSLAICLALAYVISRRIVAGVGDLQDQAARLGQGRPVQPVSNPIHEIAQIGQALQAASEQRAAAEGERAALMATLNDALANAEEAGKAKDNFLAVLGHELRNPLAPMVTALDLMDFKGSASHLREREIMRRQVDHMKRLVDDLLDVSRITQGKLEMRRQAVNLKTVIDQAVESVQPAVAERGRGIVVDVPEDVWVAGDETRLVQVVTNLLVNALRFDQEGEVSVCLKNDGRHAAIVVRDHGTGMTPEIQAQVFMPFFQAPQSIARSSGGLGLGLAIVRSIVELHGGTASASSDGLGKGSRFEVRLPVGALPAMRMSDARTANTTRPVRIVAVDDNADAVTTLAEMLRTAGHGIEVAHDAHAGLALICASRPDIAILDVGLPDMDGCELARTIRARMPEWTGTLIALTGYGQEADRTRSAAAGFHHHLTKPVKVADLLQVINATGEARADWEMDAAIGGTGTDLQAD